MKSPNGIRTNPCLPKGRVTCAHVRDREVPVAYLDYTISAPVRVLFKGRGRRGARDTVKGICKQLLLYY